jgi:uncharacterized delta-60 repeat protein
LRIDYRPSRSRLSSFLLGLLTATALAAAPVASAAPGDLDPSFGSGGSIRLLPSEESVALRAVAVQPDLKIALAGLNADTNSVILVRLLPRGAMDPGFGVGGQVTTSFPGGFGEAQAVALQPDGKIVIVGATKGDGGSDFLVARYNSDGSPDGGFGGGDGIQATPIAAGKEERAEAVAIGASGRILVTGEISLGGGSQLAGVAVLKAEGEPDATFSGDGVTAIDTTTPDDDEGVAIAELPDGRALVGDETGAGAGDGFTLVRLLASGVPDPEFGGGTGYVKTPIPGGGGAEGRLTDFVVRPDGRIVASGYGYDENLPSNEDSKFAAVGYLANGALDPSFGTGGFFIHQVGVESDARAIEQTPDGKFVLAGHYDAAGDNSISLARIDSSGVLDTGFGSGGQVLRGVSAPFGDNFEDAALDAEERTVVVSRAYIGGGNTEVVVARYMGDKVPLEPIRARKNPALPCTDEGSAEEGRALGPEGFPRHRRGPRRRWRAESADRAQQPPAVRGGQGLAQGPALPGDEEREAALQGRQAEEGQVPPALAEGQGKGEVELQAAGRAAARPLRRLRPRHRRPRRRRVAVQPQAAQPLCLPRACAAALTPSFGGS